MTNGLFLFFYKNYIFQLKVFTKGGFGGYNGGVSGEKWQKVGDKYVHGSIFT